MKINFKTGLRRIVLALIGFGVLCALIGYCTNGLIFDDWKFIRNIKIINEKNNKEVLLSDFLLAYEPINNHGQTHLFDFKCYPYKQFCECDDSIQFSDFKQNGVINGLVTNNYIIEDKFKINMPSKFQYFMWQVQDFLLIFLIAGLIYGIYLLFEKIVIWIFKGFKSED